MYLALKEADDTPAKGVDKPHRSTCLPESVCAGDKLAACGRVPLHERIIGEGLEARELTRLREPFSLTPTLLPNVPPLEQGLE